MVFSMLGKMISWSRSLLQRNQRCRRSRYRTTGRWNPLTAEVTKNQRTASLLVVQGVLETLGFVRLSEDSVNAIVLNCVLRIRALRSFESGVDDACLTLRNRQAWGRCSATGRIPSRSLR